MDVNFLNLYLNKVNMPVNQVKFGMSNPSVNNNSISTDPSVENDSFVKQSVKPLNPKIQSDIHNVKDTFEKAKSRIDELDNKAYKNKELTHTALAALSPIVPFRRISSVPDKIDNKDYIGVAGTVAIAGIMLPEDLRDVKSAWNQIFKGILPKYNYKEFQTPFSFIRGSFLEKFINKFMCNKYGQALYEWDKSLLETKFGQKIMNLLKVEKIDEEITGRKVQRIIEEDGKYIVKEVGVKAIKLEGTIIGKLICRGLQRTTLYGTLALSAVCIPSIVKAFNKPQNTKDKFANTGKQTVKSAISVVSTLSGIGLGGALLAPLGPAGSVVGMGIGCIVGAYISGKINKNIKNEN